MSTTAPISSRVKDVLKSESFEVTMRMGLNMFIGYALTFANISFITPVETNILMGILVPFCTMLFPTLAFSFGSIVLPLFSLFLFIFLSSSALLAIAATAGIDTFVAMFALWCFWVCFTRWDKIEGNKTSIMLIGVVFQTVLVFPTIFTIQSGFTVPTQFLPSQLNGILMDMTSGALEAAVQLGEGLHHVEIMESGPLQGQTAHVTISENGSSSISLDGGLWLIREAWMSRGVENPFAVYTNFMAWVCWLIIVLSVGILLPPIRTMRAGFSRGILPAAMRDAAKSIRLHAARMKYAKSKINQGDADNDEKNGNDDDLSPEKRMTIRGRCIYHVNALFAGTLAKYSVLEPRLLAFKPAQWTVALLVMLSEVTARCVRIAVGIELLVDINDDSEFLHHLTDEYLHAATVLENCAAAIQTNNVSLLDAVDDGHVQKQIQCVRVQDTTPLLSPDDDVDEKEDKIDVIETAKDDDDANEEDVASDIDDQASNTSERSKASNVIDDINSQSSNVSESVEEVNLNSINMYDPFEMKQRCVELVALSRKWLNAMDDNASNQTGYFSAESIDAFKKNIQPWIQLQLSHYVFLYGVIRDMFRISTWKNLVKSDSYALTRAIWCFKYSMGMTLLLVSFIYWESYRKNFVVLAKEGVQQTIFSLQNGGWTLVAYCFATTQTAEGSIKKGILRMIGTVAGSFSAWLALLICEDERYSNDYNTYGIVAWLTITSIVATYIATEKGFAARISLSNDYAFGPIYFVITQIIIVCYAFFYYGADSKGTLTVNRLLSNLIGILIAMVLAIIPPGNYGGDPGHCLSIVKVQWNATEEVLRLLLSCRLSTDGTPLEEDCQTISDKLVKLRQQTLEQCTKMQTMAMDYEKDAAKLQKMPIFKVDPRLKMELGKVTRDVNITAFIPLIAARLLSDPSRRFVMLGRESMGREELESIYADIQRGLKPENIVTVSADNETSRNTSLETDAETDLELLLRTLQWLKNEMLCHTKVCDQIRWGFRHHH